MNNSYILGEVLVYDIFDFVGLVLWKIIFYLKDGYSFWEIMILFVSWSFLEMDRLNKFLLGLWFII